jgi:hypothetical protein
MPIEKNKWIDAVGKLLQLTQDGKLRWQPRDAPAYLNLERDRKRVEVVYEAKYNNRKLRLYQFSYKVEKPRSSLSAFKDLSAYINPPEYPFWTTKTALELLDQSGFGAWTFPETEVLDDLAAAVRYQVAGVKEFLDEILAVAS